MVQPIDSPFFNPLQPKEQVCRPEPVEAPICEADPSTLQPCEIHTTAPAAEDKARPKLDMSQLYAQANLDLQLEDKNGLLQTGQRDIQNRLQGEIVLNGDLHQENFAALSLCRCTQMDSGPGRGKRSAAGKAQGQFDLSSHHFMLDLRK
ncbi:hypothetical protein COW36_18130 [bacterium (Candidatus Blackallbacteria) CG17_big_fil_post_rev_8_21_14_2_50_48_46]|uniref:Uncharacterized protein n=1 Tax=bacterium (Candidatus Blackallbacteria) CG17_big_fil_post_rev_8_21_14_2_50_48_46 TaxID=2014261 RepID=A0A2M7G0U2_9BACT|nr:MAG: hypothetical protein COW64_00600 [bacterium (Candidatus Blackallbacteria) CG18_big_fil_WC_8_21_14_2_50_49_26]PIW15334.1 MAG: hypothetical protein COW36_18130 [bacterium (Candidatus Blackallbacteria) CG17_big_fil_post_rev_8_21_14_2_50_48_46]PIW49805.1 MAG: hypothetical protein COW20_05235 [bacterium (Candidatus Blackallbacteria) CG13_big_fil_rev_8_21_14_2_50_49_14]